jgi:hypothetical protein
MKARRKRRWVRFSLRTFLALFVAAALLLGYTARVWHGHQKKVALIREIEARGGSVKVESRGPNWVRRWGEYHAYGIAWNPPIGVFDRVVGVRLKRVEGTDDFLPRLSGFPGLKSLDLSRSDVTNDGVRHIARLTTLEELNLGYTAITDDCMSQVGQLVRLRELDLGHTRVCGRGFHRLEALPALEELTLVFTPIRDDALEPLKAIQSLSLCNVWSCRHLSRQATEDFQAARPDCLLFGLHTLEPHWDRQNADRETRR